MKITFKELKNVYGKDENEETLREVYEKIKDKKEFVFECQEPKCQHIWKSDKLETKCKFCDSNKVTFMYDPDSKPPKFIYAFDQEEWP